PGQFVSNLVLFVAVVPAHPTPLDSVASGRGFEPDPEVDVRDGLTTVRIEPALFLPALNPLGHALLNVLRVGGEDDLARTLQGLERDDRAHELHAVVGGLELAAGESLCHAIEAEEDAPAAWPWVARDGAVGEDL